MESPFLFGLKEKVYSSFTSFLFFNPVNNVLALTFTCSLIFFLLETKCNTQCHSKNRTEYKQDSSMLLSKMSLKIIILVKNLEM